MIKICHLKKEYESITPLQDVNVKIHRGDVISIIGPSGTGKSTLIRCINMFEFPTSGEIWVDGELITDKKCNINKIRQKMGMVFQISLPLKLKKTDVIVDYKLMYAWVFYYNLQI